MLFLPLLAIAGVASASPAPVAALSPLQSSLLCKGAGAALSILTKPAYSSSALAFCSSYIHIPAVTQVAGVTSLITATARPSTNTVTATSFVNALTTTTSISTSTSTATATVTTTVRSAETLVERDLALPASLDERGTTTNSCADALKAVPALIISLGCSCIKDKIPLKTVTRTTTALRTASTFTPVVNITPTTTTVTITSVVTEASIAFATTTTTSTVTATATPAILCEAPNYGLFYSQVLLSSNIYLGGFNLIDQHFNDISDPFGCCNQCAYTPGCVRYSLAADAGCSITINSPPEPVLGEDPVPLTPYATDQCPNGQAIAYTGNLASPGVAAAYGTGGCANEQK